METDEEKRWRCEECRGVSLEAGLLTAPSPFNINETLTGCPYCLGCGKVELLCDDPGCESKATAGFPTEKEDHGGYRRTCYKHTKQR